MLKRVCLFAILSSFYLLSSNVLYAQQKKWTLEECIRYAETHNLTILQQELNFQLTEVNLRQSKGMMLPNISANATNTYNYGRTVDRFTNDFVLDMVRSNNFYVSANMTLFNGFQLLNNVKKSISDLKASQMDLLSQKNQISLTITTAFLQILYCNEMLSSAEKQLNLTIEQVDRSRKMYEAGTLAESILLSNEAQAASEEYQKVTAKANLDAAYLTLVQLLDLPSADEFELVFPEVDIAQESVPYTAENVYNTALKTQPDIKSAEFRLESSQKSLAIAKGGISPSITVGTSIGSGYSGASKKITDIQLSGYDTVGITTGLPPQYVLSPVYNYLYSPIPFSDQIHDNYNRTIGFNMSIPLFNSLQTSSNIKKSKIQVQMSEVSLEQTKQNLRKTINQAHLDAVSALQKYFSAKKQLQALSSAYLSAQKQYEVGAISPFEYQQAKNKFIIAESDLLQAKYEYVFKMKVLDFYMGNSVILQSK